jgi:SnoaL-like domain
MADIETVEAHLAISRVKARYCRMLDTKNWAELGKLFTEDCVLDVSEGTSVPVIHGRDAALRQIQSSLAAARTAHQVHAPEIDLEGDEAHVIWAMQDRVVWDPPRGGIASLTGYGHYHERYVRRDGEWKIAALRLSRLHIDMQAASSA